MLMKGGSFGWISAQKPPENLVHKLSASRHSTRPQPNFCRNSLILFEFFKLPTAALVFY